VQNWLEDLKLCDFQVLRRRKQPRDATGPGPRERDDLQGAAHGHDQQLTESRNSGRARLKDVMI